MEEKDRRGKEEEGKREREKVIARLVIASLPTLRRRRGNLRDCFVVPLGLLAMTGGE